MTPLDVFLSYEPIREQNAILIGAAAVCFLVAYLGRGGKKKKR